MIIESKTFGAYFILYLVTILTGIVATSTNGVERFDFVSIVLVFFSVLSFSSTYGYVQWILAVLTPDTIIEYSFSRIDERYVDKVVEIKRENYNPDEHTGFVLRKTPLNLIEDDPLGRLVDVVLSAIDQDDTSVASKGIQKIENAFIPLAIHLESTEVRDINDRGFPELNSKYGHIDKKLFTWHFIGAFNQLYNKSRTKSDDQTTYEVMDAISTITVSAIDKELFAIPFQTIRYFGRISTELPGNVDDEVVNDVNKMYSDIEKSTFEVLGSVNRNLTFIGQYVRWRRSFALSAIEDGYFRIGYTAVYSYIQFTKRVAENGYIPAECAISLGMIGERLAQEQVEFMEIIHGAGTDVAYRNYVEDTISHISRLRSDLIELNQEKGYDLNIELLDDQISRIEDSFQPRTDEIHDHISEAYPDVSKTNLSLVWEFFHRTHSKFVIEDLDDFFRERGQDSSIKELEDMLNTLMEINLVRYYDNSEEYSAALRDWNPEKWES